MLQTKTKYIYYGTLISLIGILLGSLSHLAYFFGTGEAEGVIATHWVIAIAMELGLMALGFGLVVIKQQRRSELGLFIYLGLFVFISLIGNTYYSLSVITGVKSLHLKDLKNIDPLVIFRIICSSSILPLLILVLTRLQSVFFLKWKAEERALLAGAVIDEFGNIIQTVKRTTKKGKSKEEKIIVDTSVAAIIAEPEPEILRVEPEKPVQKLRVDLDKTLPKKTEPEPVHKKKQNSQPQKK